MWESSRERVSPTIPFHICSVVVTLFRSVVVSEVAISRLEC